MATHLLHIAEIDDEGHVTWDATCLNGDSDPRRDCLLVTELKEPCEWDLWENGDHHPTCPRSEWPSCEERDLDTDEMWACWESRIPDECDGTDHPELGHAHPTTGCGLREWMSLAGFGENVFLTKSIIRPSYPVGVRVIWDNDGIDLEEADK